MAGKIQLTPAELLAQSQEMLSLQKEFETLFGQTKTLLDEVNQNWSSNLANNFAGKLISAQKSFANVVSMLEQGGNLAATSAQTFESMDSLLSKVMSGEWGAVAGSVGSGIAGVAGGIAGAVGGIGGAGGILGGLGAAGLAGATGALADVDWSAVGGKLSEFGSYAWNQLKEDWQNAGESMEWLGDKYNQLPDEVKKKIEEALGGALTTSISITYDIVTGNVTWDTAYDFIGEVFEGSSTGQAIIGTLKEVFEGGALERQSYYDQLSYDQIDEGHVLAGLSTQCGAFVDTILIGAVDVLGDMGTGIIEDLPLVGLVTDALGFDLSDTWDGWMSSAHEGMNDFITNTTEAIGEFEENAQEFISDAWDAGTEFVSDAWDAGTEFVGDAIDAGKDFCNAAGDAIADIGDGIAEGLSKLKFW